MGYATVVTIPAVNAGGINNWTNLTDLIIAARVAAGQPALPQFTHTTIRYQPDKDNAGLVFMTTEPTSLAEGKVLSADETFEDSGFSGSGVSTRKWYVKSQNGTEKMDILMED